MVEEVELRGCFDHVYYPCKEAPLMKFTFSGSIDQYLDLRLNDNYDWLFTTEHAHELIVNCHLRARKRKDGKNK